MWIVILFILFFFYEIIWIVFFGQRTTKFCLTLFWVFLVGERNGFDYKMPSQKIETGHEDTVHDVAMDYYGKRIATASSDHSIKITGVNNNTFQHLANLTGHQGPVWQVAWAHPKFGSLLASCSYDGRVIIWKEGNQNDWTQAHVFDDHKASVNSIAWAPHELGLSLACGSSDGNICFYCTC